MPKSRWQQGFEALAQELRQVAAGRRAVSAHDAAADGLDFAAARAEEKVRTLLEPTTMLTPEEWAAEQDPPVAAGTARRWCREGELECIETARGYLIPVGTERKPKSALRLMQAMADYEQEDERKVVNGDPLAGDWPQGVIEVVEPAGRIEAAS